MSDLKPFYPLSARMSTFLLQFRKAKQDHVMWYGGHSSTTTAVEILENFVEEVKTLEADTRPELIEDIIEALEKRLVEIPAIYLANDNARTGFGWAINVVERLKSKL